MLAAGAPLSAITYVDIFNPGTNYAGQILSATNVAGYFSWGYHSALPGGYATNGLLNWHGNSGWWIIDTAESYNGLRNANQPTYILGNFDSWFNAKAFGGTNYENTPIGSVSHVYEPSATANAGNGYFGLWQAGLNFGQVA